MVSTAHCGPGADVRAGRLYAGAACAVLTVSSCAWLDASAFEFATGAVEGSLDTTVSIGVQGRTQSIDHSLVGTRALSPGDTAQKGSAYSVNGDDGTLNYERGITGLVGRFTTELDVSITSRTFGAFVRAEGYYDPINARRDNTDHIKLSKPARDQIAQRLRLLDAYGELNLSPGGLDTSIRGGRQVLSWGESTFIPGGINVINAVDVSQLRTPGAELRNALLPQGMVSLNSAIGENVTVEGFYQYDWKEVRIDRPGTLFSTNDFVGKGQDKAMLGFGDFSEFGTDVQTLFGGPAAFGGINTILAFPAGLTGVTGTPYGALPTLTAFEPGWFGVPRGDNDKPSDSGQYGVALRAFVPRLNDTELGFYFINYHSRLPIISAKTASAADTIAAASQVDKLAANGGAAAASAVGANSQGQASRYFIEYPEDIKLLGASFNTQLGTSGWALQGEYSFKIDKPLQVDDAELLFASLTPLDTQLRAQTAGLLSTPFTLNQLGTFGPDSVIHGFVERDVSQLQVTATKVLGPIVGADTGIFLAEVGAHYVHDMPSKSALRLNGPGTNTSGNSAQSAAGGAHAGKDAESWSHFPDSFSWGYRLAGRLDFNSVLGLVNVSPRLQWQHDVGGVSPGPGGPFLQGRKAVSVGVSATYLQSWVADVSWTGFFGAGRYNLINDRDFWAASLKYSF
jgi:hypothetical protein